MLRILLRLTALLTFVVGLSLVWYFQQPAPISSHFRVIIPTPPVPLSRDEIARLPQSCGHLVVSISTDGSLRLNESIDVGTVEDTNPLRAALSEIFQQRIQARAYDSGMESRADLSDEERILRVVFIKAPRSMPYVDVVKVIDAVKDAGARPIGLQLDELPQ